MFCCRIFYHIVINFIMKWQTLAMAMVIKTNKCGNMYMYKCQYNNFYVKIDNYAC